MRLNFTPSRPKLIANYSGLGEVENVLKARHILALDAVQGFSPSAISFALKGQHKTPLDSHINHWPTIQSILTEGSKGREAG